MTIFGPDVSSFQRGLDLSRLADASFVIAKASEGTYYTDADYAGWRKQAAAIGKLFCWYHFLTTEDVHAQVAHTLACVGDPQLPGMLDVEPEGASHPTLAQVLAYIDAAHTAGLNLRLVYLPAWYWQQLGSPSLTGIAARGVHLVSSSYPGGSGTAVQEYPGDSAPGWAPYGGMAPLIYQFTNRAADGGQDLDFNAFRGSVAQLAAYWQASAPTSGGTTMGTIPASITTKWPALAGDFPANTSFDSDTALIWADAGARQAALVAQQTLDAVTALAAKLGPQPVDVAQLAASLGPLLHPTTDVDALVAALVPHLPGTPDPVAFADALISHVHVS